MTDEKKIAGVHHLGADGNTTLVHAYTDEDYELFDIVELFALGTMERSAAQEDPVFSIQRGDLRRLKVQADAESFDHPEGFIEMCLDIYRFGEQTDSDPLKFFSEG